MLSSHHLTSAGDGLELPIWPFAWPTVSPRHAATSERTDARTDGWVDGQVRTQTGGHTDRMRDVRLTGKHTHSDNVAVKHLVTFEG